jgi:hypothetical protein
MSKGDAAAALAEREEINGLQISRTAAAPVRVLAELEVIRKKCREI